METKLHSAPELGSIMSGGRYDNLAENLGKNAMPGVGMSIGLSRLCSWLLNQPAWAETAATPADVLVACMDEALMADYARLADALRADGLNVEMALGGQKLGTQLKNADKRGVRWAVVVGSDEVTRGVVQLKDLRAGEQVEVPVSEVAKTVAAR